VSGSAFCLDKPLQMARGLWSQRVHPLLTGLDESCTFGSSRVFLTFPLPKRQVLYLPFPYTSHPEQTFAGSSSMIFRMPPRFVSTDGLILLTTHLDGNFQPLMVLILAFPRSNPPLNSLAVGPSSHADIPLFFPGFGRRSPPVTLPIFSSNVRL